MPLVNRVEQHVITKQHPLWKSIDQNCFYSKNLYNYANYLIRQEFINNGKWIRYGKLDKLCQQSEPYKELMSQPSQATLQSLDKAWQSFFVAIKDYMKNPTKYLGKPKLPKYKNKEGRSTWFIKNNSVFIKNGELHFKVNRLKGYIFKTSVTNRLICVRFVPNGSNYIMEVVYEKEIQEIKPDNNRYASIDLGVNNFVTMVNNIGLSPIIVNGKGVKSVNQFYNKRKAKLQSELKIRHGKNWSKLLEAITHKRNMRIKNYIHHVSKFVVQYCVENEINTLVCGYNKEWKQGCSMGKSGNQKFTYLPYEMLISQLVYKCQDFEINFIQTEESYTSGTSFLDGEIPCKENYDKSRRVQRGLFQAGTQLINSDVNGSLQILRKVFPDAFGYGIEGSLTPTVINVTKVA